MRTQISPIPLDDKATKKLDSFRDTTYTGEACGGMVKVTLSFSMDCIDVKIDPELAASVELLEELISNAHNEAVKLVKDA